MNKAIPYIGGAVAIFLLWYSLDAHEQKSQAAAKVELLQQQVVELEQQVAQLTLQLEETKKETVSGVVEEAQTSLKQGLRGMLDAAEHEFGRLQEILDETLTEWEQSQQQKSTPKVQPNDESKSEPEAEKRPLQET